MAKRKENIWNQRPDSSIVIELTQGQVALIDECDLDKVLAHKWAAHLNRRTWYACTNLDAGTWRL